MLKAVLVDDEKPALLQLERLIVADNRLKVVGSYMSAQACIERLAEDQPDIVFLDIGMPGMNGLEAAELMRQLNPDLPFVYVTAYSEYAIEAFELNALDYLLKPVHPERFAKTLDRVLKERTIELAANDTAEPFRILCFGQLQLVPGALAGESPKWRTSKAQELFAFLLHHRGQWVAKDRLLEALWPDFEYNKAVTHLHTSVYQVRSILKKWGSRALLEYALDSYRLTQVDWTTDVDEFERLSFDFPELTKHNRELYSRKLALYRGEYLENHDYPWAETRRNVLQQHYMRFMLGLAESELQSGFVREAIDRLSELQAKEPYSDEICRMMMYAFARAENWDGLKRHYEKFVSLIRGELGIEPDPETRSCYERLMRSRN